MPKGVRDSGTARESPLSLEEARQERERLQARLHELEAHDAKRYAVIGRVIMRLAESDEAFATQLRGILERGVTDRHERLALGLDKSVRRGGRGRRRKAEETPSNADAAAVAMAEELP